MNTPATHPSDTLELLLGNDPSTRAWAVLDGATVKGLVRAIGTHGVSSACLFAGKLHPSMARVAPRLVAIERDCAFTEWVLERGWGRSWGIFLRSKASLEELRKHLRRFLLVKDPEGKVMQFRYYDPRVLRVYLPTCNGEERALLFGPVEAYLMEGEDPRRLLVFDAAGGSTPEEIRLEDRAVRGPSPGVDRG